MAFPNWLPALTNRVRATNSYVVDSALAVAVAIPMSVPFLTVVPGITVLGVLLNVGAVLPLIWRRRAPYLTTVAIVVFAALVSLHHHPGQMLQYSALVAVYTIADLGRRWQRLSILWLAVFTIAPAAILFKHNSVAELMFTSLLPVATYLLGTLARTNRARIEALAQRAAELERRRAADAARASAEERARIARDMHDVLAHAVSVMVVQAEAGPLVVRGDPDRAERVFDDIAEAGRSAMLQLSATVGALRAGTDAAIPGPATSAPDVVLRSADGGSRAPHPTLAAIASLVDAVRRAGVPVDLCTQGSPRPLRPDTEVAAYRIVQEALTNTLKHGGNGSATVDFDWRADLRITVTNVLGQTARRATLPSGGRGLIGIRERAAACGGLVDAGPTPTGFRVSVQLPLATTT
jgi:signal transduction histidine kinase